MQFNILQQDYSLMLSEELHTCRHTLKCTKTHTQNAWLLNTRGLTRYSSAICGEHCCIPYTQYAQHIIFLISLTLSLSVFLLFPLFLSPSLPHLCSLIYFFLLIITPLFRHWLPPFHSHPHLWPPSFFLIYPHQTPLCCYLLGIYLLFLFLCPPPECPLCAG